MYLAFHVESNFGGTFYKSWLNSHEAPFLHTPRQWKWHCFLLTLFIGLTLRLGFFFVVSTISSASSGGGLGTSDDSVESPKTFVIVMTRGSATIGTAGAFRVPVVRMTT